MKQSSYKNMRRHNNICLEYLPKIQVSNTLYDSIKRREPIFEAGTFHVDLIYSTVNISHNKVFL